MELDEEVLRCLRGHAMPISIDQVAAHFPTRFQEGSCSKDLLASAPRFSLGRT